MTKIIVRIFGGIGNQLFCYAAARRMALVNEAELVLDDISGFKYDYQYQRFYQLNHFNIKCRSITAEECSRFNSRIKRFMHKKFEGLKPFEQRTYLEQKNHDLDLRLLNFKPHDFVYLDGYWQSETYFKSVEEEIRNDLQIVPPIDAENLDMALKIMSCKSVAVHLRFFDKHGDSELNNLPIDYYTAAVGMMEQLVPGAHYFIFSDNISQARKKIPLPDARITQVSHNIGDELAYADLFLMTKCQNFIIANSTFSWWGAWLSAFSEKHVISPRAIYSDNSITWRFEGLIPDNWITLG